MTIEEVIHQYDGYTKTNKQAKFKGVSDVRMMGRILGSLEYTSGPEKVINIPAAYALLHSIQHTWYYYALSTELSKPWNPSTIKNSLIRT